MVKKLEELDLKKRTPLPDPSKLTQQEIWENLSRMAKRLLALHRAGMEAKKNEIK